MDNKDWTRMQIGGIVGLLKWELVDLEKWCRLHENEYAQGWVGYYINRALEYYAKIKDIRGSL